MDQIPILEVEGDDLMRELSHRSVGFLALYAEEVKSSSIYAYFCMGDGLNGQPQVGKLGYYKTMPFAAFLDVVSERHWENIHTRKR